MSWTILAPMKTVFWIAALSIAAFCALNARAQSPSPTPLSPDKQVKRDAARERLRAVLTTLPSGIPITFKQSEKQPYNFVGVYKSAELKNTGGFEVVVGVSTDETVSFRIYPYFNAGYVNLDKSKNGVGLMRQLLRLSDTNFLYWGADATGDVFAGYTFTLESGFPDEAIRVILWSIKPLDQYVGEMRPNIDGSNPVH
jgi:hypothetical protein